MDDGLPATRFKLSGSRRLIGRGFDLWLPVHLIEQWMPDDDLDSGYHVAMKQKVEGGRWN